MWSLLLPLLLGALAGAEVVQFQPCPQSSEDSTPPAPNCTVHEVRISPCAEAAENKPCKIKRGRSASIQFDFTPTVAVDAPTGRAFWTNQVGDLPFVGMDTNACNFTTCPLAAGTRQTYDYQLSISKKFPVRAYDVKWRLWNEQTDVLECCFIAKIKLTK
ncbi:MD-2-related lipid-recognition protein-like [Periplaneta americana]|uniref:MD-2-related lipid-recognition protein-like n=1 Tax=Periplaneta americana TaxID=6978 RepID=UPI0037E83745